MRPDPNRWFTCALRRRPLTPQEIADATARTRVRGLALGVAVGFALARLPPPWSWGGVAAVSVFALVAAHQLDQDRRSRR